MIMMPSPAGKAKELVSYFESEINNLSPVENDFRRVNPNSEIAAKRMAIKHCDDIADSFIALVGQPWRIMNATKEYFQYWQDVKFELQKL